MAIVAAQEFEDPLEVPLILVPDADEALHRLGASFYNDPSQKMTVIAIAGLRFLLLHSHHQDTQSAQTPHSKESSSKIAALLGLEPGRGSYRKYGVR